MTQAQQIADLAQRDFSTAMRTACEKGHRSAVWYAGCEYTFEDGSILVVRSGKIDFPLPTPVKWTAKLRDEFDV